MNKKIKLVIFDLDGVLVDACEWHRLSLNKALKIISNYEISEEEHKTTFNGIPTKVKLEKLVEMKRIDREDCEKIYNLKQELTIETIEENAKHRSEKVQMIKALKESGIKVACFTNSIRETATLMLLKTGVLNQLDLLITNQDVKKPKPHPEGYNKIVEEYGLEPSSVIIVEDSPKGMQAALASGCNVISVNNPEEVEFKIFEEYLK